MSEEIKEELEEDVDFELKEEEIEETVSETEEDTDVEFDYDEEGNIVIADDSETEEESEEVPSEEIPEDNDKTHEKQETPVEENDPPATDDAEPAAAPDAKDLEIEKLRKQLNERDSQIKDTLKSLGADENGGIAELERIAAEATDTPLEEYRKKKAEREEQEEAKRIVKEQRFKEMIRADLALVHQTFPETKKYKSVFDFPNFAKFSKYRDLGLPPDEAYIAANPKGVISSVAGAVQQQARNLNGTKDHLHSNVPVGSKDKSITVTKKQMSEYKDLFPNMSDKEIIALYKQTMKK